MITPSSCGFPRRPGAWVAAALALTAAVAATPAPLRAAETDLIKNPRQLTLEGRRSGEGYFSADGRKLVFQSEREPGNPFYQIYLMDLETGDTSRVSPFIRTEYHAATRISLPDKGGLSSWNCKYSVCGIVWVLKRTPPGS